VHLAGGDVQIDAVERAHPRELLDDAPHRQQWLSSQFLTSLCAPAAQPRRIDQCRATTE
jgi:hypothetical protein